LLKRYADDDILNPSSQLLSIGSNTSLHCNAHHVKGWDFTRFEYINDKILGKQWLLNLEPIVFNAQLQDGGKTIVIKSVEKNNEGVFMCAGYHIGEGFFYAASTLYVTG